MQELINLYHSFFLISVVAYLQIFQVQTYILILFKKFKKELSKDIMFYFIPKFLTLSIFNPLKKKSFKHEKEANFCTKTHFKFWVKKRKEIVN